MSNEEKMKNMIAEKDNVKLKYKQKLNEIKQHYGIEFDVNHFKNEKIKSIKFTNLKYKKCYENMSIIYDGNSMKANYIEYDYTDSRVIKNSSHKKLLSDLEKEFKLKLIVSEIDRLNNEYLREIQKIDMMYQNLDDFSSPFGRVLEIDKDDEN